MQAKLSNGNCSMAERILAADVTFAVNRPLPVEYKETATEGIEKGLRICRAALPRYC
jgi:hypothetical protein